MNNTGSIAIHAPGPALWSIELIVCLEPRCANRGTPEFATGY